MFNLLQPVIQTQGDMKLVLDEKDYHTVMFEMK